MTITCARPARDLPDRAETPAIRVSGLSKRYALAAPPALEGIDISVRAGRIFGLLGPNGAGKTTLLCILCGLLRPTRGSVFIEGVDLATDARRARSALGVVPQEPAVYPTLTAGENLRYFGRMQGLSGARLEARLKACLELAQLADLADTRVEHFSGGYKRRLNLVIGLIHEPRILILDEPTVAIDPHSRALIHQRLRELHGQGVSIILSTHSMEEAEELCDEVAIMSHGRVVTQGEVAALLNGQRHDLLSLRLQRQPGTDLLARLEAQPGVAALAHEGRCLRVRSADPARTALALLDILRAAGMGVESLSFGAASLQQLFLSLTAEEATR